MIFKVLTKGIMMNKKIYFIQEKNTKGNLILDIGDPLYFADKQTAEMIAEGLNKEFGRKK